MTWSPGMPVVTQADHAEWRKWRHQRALKLQRERRASLPTRVDYYPSREASAILGRLRGKRTGQDNSSVINAALELYAQQWTPVIPEFDRPK
jgi:hypothetical protein